MKYCVSVSLAILLAIGNAAAVANDVAYLPAPAFATSAESSVLTAESATYFPGMGDATELIQASCLGDCGDACDACGQTECCCRTRYLWGEFLYLNPRDVDVAFAKPINGAIIPPVNNPIPVGPAAVLDTDYSPGFRVGFAIDLADPCARIGAEYTHFESHTHAETAIDAPYAIRSLVTHPQSTNATSDWLAASGNLDIDFDLFDLDYRRTIRNCDRSSLNYLLGVRFAHLDQDFSSRFVNNSIEAVSSSINFDGAGLRIGLEGERRNCRGLMLYGKAIASVVAGEFRADYLQQQGTDTVVADTAWKAGRVVGMFDLELGTGWQSCNGCLRLTTGYMFSTWVNTINVDEYIGAVQTNNYVGLGDHMTFDGLVARVEGRF